MLIHHYYYSTALCYGYFDVWCLRRPGVSVLHGSPIYIWSISWGSKIISPSKRRENLRSRATFHLAMPLAYWHRQWKSSFLHQDAAAPAGFITFHRGHIRDRIMTWFGRKGFKVVWKSMSTGCLAFGTPAFHDLSIRKRLVEWKPH